MPIEIKTDFSEVANRLCTDAVGFNSEYCGTSSLPSPAQLLPFGINKGKGNNYWSVHPFALEGVDYYITVVGLSEEICKGVLDSFDSQNVWRVYVGNHLFTDMSNRNAMKEKCNDSFSSGWGNGKVSFVMINNR